MTFCCCFCLIWFCEMKFDLLVSCFHIVVLVCIEIHKYTWTKKNTILCQLCSYYLDYYLIFEEAFCFTNTAIHFLFLLYIIHIVFAFVFIICYIRIASGAIVYLHLYSQIFRQYYVCTLEYQLPLDVCIYVCIVNIYKCIYIYMSVCMYLVTIHCCYYYYYKFMCM